MLKIHKLTFISVKITSISETVLLMVGIKRKSSAETQASIRFVSGPATPTSATPNSSYFTLFGLKGTGLAAKIGGKPSKISTTGSNIVVTRSICLSGFRLSRPCSSAVVSPSQWLVKACMASCVLIAMSSDPNTMRSCMPVRS